MKGDLVGGEETRGQEVKREGQSEWVCWRRRRRGEKKAGARVRVIESHHHRLAG